MLRKGICLSYWQKWPVTSPTKHFKKITLFNVILRMASEREYLNHVDLSDVCHIVLAVMTFSIMVTTCLKYFTRKRVPDSPCCSLLHFNPLNHPNRQDAFLQFP